MDSCNTPEQGCAVLPGLNPRCSGRCRGARAPRSWARRCPPRCGAGGVPCDGSPSRFPPWFPRGKPLFVPGSCFLERLGFRRGKRLRVPYLQGFCCLFSLLETRWGCRGPKGSKSHPLVAAVLSSPFGTACRARRGRTRSCPWAEAVLVASPLLLAQGRQAACVSALLCFT